MGLPDVKFHEGWPISATGSGVPGQPPHVRTSRRWRRWHTWILLATVALVALIAVAVVGLRVNSYEPLAYGGDSTYGLAYPGLPAAHGARTVNTFGGVREDVYIPPHRGTFYLFGDVANYGSGAVTIVSVTLPRDTALKLAGHVRYAPLPAAEGYGAPSIPPASHVLRPVTLGAGKDIFVAIPVRAWPCWTKHYGFTTVPNFYVTYRRLFFTHTVAIPWGMHNDELIMHSPGGRPGQPGVVCAGR
jgi:hypothetical protein